MSALLQSCESKCEQNAPIIVSKEKSCAHYAINADRNNVRQYKIDGEVVPRTDNRPACDYLVLNDDKKTAYFIELKGSDILRAIKQVEETEKMLKNELSDYSARFRIVYKSGTHDIQNSLIVEWKRRMGKTRQKIKQAKLDEVI
jgi:hypothetical protein